MSVDAAVEEQFGPYLVYERLGVGGMATVHRALEQGAEGFERMVALKRLLPHLAEDASFIKSFVREAKLASLLNHVNIVQIYELGRVGTEYFITMEYIDGRDVRRVLRHARKVTGPPPIHITVGILIQLCDALDYAHNKVDNEGHPLGLVHRDISPSNLIITSGGHLKIIDFGIAKAQSNQLRTQTGRVKGKLAYMAPEAVSGSRDLDARSDIWATGVILHEMLTARPLFASKNEYQTLLKVQKGDILPPSTFNQGCPPELDALVMRALARAPDERIANAAELREGLLALKRQYSLQTGYRDVAGWIDWAFGIEAPAGFSGDTSGVMSVEKSRSSHTKTPRPPQNPDEEEAVEVAWGSGNNESENGPVVLDEVPDVSEKHRAKRDTEDDRFEPDDIPTPLPSHGTMPSIYGTNQNLVVLAPTTDPGLPPKLVDPVLARGTDPPVARGSDQIRAQRSSGVPMPAGSKITGSQPIVRAKDGSSPPQNQPRPGRTTAQGVGTRKSDRQAAQKSQQMTAVDSPNVDQRLAAVRAGSASDDSLATNPVAKPLSAEELFGNDAERALASVSADLEAMATHTTMPVTRDEPVAATQIPSVPVVRFSKSHSIPPQSAIGGLPPAVGEAGRVPGTKPGIAPINAAAAPHPREPRPSRAPSNVQIGQAIVQRAAPRRTWLFVVGGILLAAGTATVVTILLSKGGDTDAPSANPEPALPGPSPVPAPAPAPAPRTTGTIKLVIDPADAEIKIGDATHTGSPYTSELPAGSHQIEIRKPGFKSWLTSIELSANEAKTLSVVLDRVTSNDASASLAVATTPGGLDVFIDGKPAATKSPIKTTLPVGHHTISVKQNGVEVWHQNVNAEAASDYEFNPSFTADKTRAAP